MFPSEIEALQIAKGFLSIIPTHCGAGFYFGERLIKAMHAGVVVDVHISGNLPTVKGFQLLKQ